MTAEVQSIQNTDGYFIASRYYDDPPLYAKEIMKIEPDDWQVDVGYAVAESQRVAVASGHGIGKTCTTSILIHWFMGTRPNPQIICTANTKNQLDTKTWRELAKWNNKALNGDWFKWTATRFSLKGSEETWFASAIPWSEHNSEAFAGTHEKHVLIIFDEASAIADIIWEVAEGAMTTSGAKWVAFGNPTKNTGKFHECFHKMRHRWRTFQIDSRTAKHTDKKQLKQWIDDYGEDSDFARVRIRGMFPRAGSDQFISLDIVEDAAKRTLEKEVYLRYPLLLGVDVARFGDDQTVLTLRRGRKVFPQLRFRGLDTMQVAAKAYELWRTEKVDFVFVDGVGVGAGVFDRLKQLKVPVVDVQSAEAADKSNEYYNKRAELWGRCRDWLRTAQPDIPNDVELITDLTAAQYGFDGNMRYQLEKKEDMKRRGLASPDNADSLVYTFEDTSKAVTAETQQAKPVVTVRSGAFV